MLMIIQITDTHVSADKEITYGVDAAKVLETAIEDIHANYPDASFVVHTGDIGGYEGRKEDYQRFNAIIGSLSLPIYYVPGNHDHKRSVLRSEVLKGEPTDEPVHWSLSKGDWHFVGLDSSTGDDRVGKISDEELVWLEKDLDAHKGIPTFIFLHHHVLPVGVHWLDELALENSLEFLEVIDSYPQVKYIVGGHVHLEKALYFRGKLFVTTPSLCEQYPANVQTFAVERIPPGYRVFRFKDDDSVETFVQRLNYTLLKTEYDIQD